MPAPARCPRTGTASSLPESPRQWNAPAATRRCTRSAVGIARPLTSLRDAVRNGSKSALSSSGLGRSPLKAKTRVQIPIGSLKTRGHVAGFSVLQARTCVAMLASLCLATAAAERVKRYGGSEGPAAIRLKQFARRFPLGSRTWMPRVAPRRTRPGRGGPADGGRIHMARRSADPDSCTRSSAGLRRSDRFLIGLARGRASRLRLAHQSRPGQPRQHARAGPPGRNPTRQDTRS